MVKTINTQKKHRKKISKIDTIKLSNIQHFITENQFLPKCKMQHKDIDEYLLH